MSKPTESQLATYVRALVASRARILEFAAGSVLAAILVTALLPRYHTATIHLLPSERARTKLSARMTGLASAFGIQIPVGAVSSSDLYPVLLTSDRLLRPLLEEIFANPLGGPGSSLADILVLQGHESTVVHRQRALEVMRDRVVRARTDGQSDLVSLQVTTRWPELSSQVARRLVERLDQHLIGTRQAEGAANREFLGRRRAEAEAQLVRAEQEIETFQVSNRRITDSPALLLEFGRLRREQTGRREVLLEIRRQLEIAKTEETRNMPVLRPLDDTNPPTRPTSPPYALTILLTLVIGVLAPVWWIVIRTAGTDGWTRRTAVTT